MRDLTYNQSPLKPNLTTTLRPGSSSLEVAQLQALLAWFGHYYATPSGKFDNETSLALQRAYDAGMWVCIGVVYWGGCVLGVCMLLCTGVCTWCCASLVVGVVCCGNRDCCENADQLCVHGLRCLHADQPHTLHTTHHSHNTHTLHTVHTPNPHQEP